MARKKVGDLIKEARTNAGLTQEQLAKKVDGCSSSDISKAERGEKELTQSQLKQIAKATGITQKSLLDASTGALSEKKTEKTSASGKKPSTSSGKKAENKKPASEKIPNEKVEYVLSSGEKKLIDYYRAADTETKKAAIALLKGEVSNDSSVLSTILSAAGNVAGNNSKPQENAGQDNNILGMLLSAAAGGGNAGQGNSILGSILSAAAGANEDTSDNQPENQAGGLASLLTSLLK